MVFSSVIFLWIFLPVVFLGNLLVGRKWSNIFLLLASLIFYAWGEPVRVIIMIFSVIWNWAAGLLIEKTKHKKLSLIAGVAVDLGFLAVFKYAGFFVESLNSLFGTELSVPSIALPIGISFYTFQAMSYVIDVYRGNVEASKNPLRVLLYISFFPQLIAGPIVKYRDIEQELTNRVVSIPEASAGFRRFLFGLSKKVLIANTMAVAADAIFNADLDRGCGVSDADLFRLQRIQRHGHRYGADVRLPFPGEFRLPLCGGEHKGFLDPLAYLTFFVV